MSTSRRRVGDFRFSVASIAVACPIISPTWQSAAGFGAPFMTHTVPEIRSRLEAFLSTTLGVPVRVIAARQLTGGASRESWAVDVEVCGGSEAGPHALVLRRDLGGTIHEEALSREQEFQVLMAAYQAGVLVPRPRWLCA